MTFLQLSNIFISWGFQIKPYEYQAFEYYTQEMLRRDRVMVIRDEQDFKAVIFYYLTNDYTKLYKKSTWETPGDEPEGHQIYMDKVVCQRWTKELRGALKRAILDKFPQVQEGYYHRAPNDRCVKILRGTGELCPKI